MSKIKKRLKLLKSRRYTIFQKFVFLGIIPVMIIFSLTYVDFMIRYRTLRIEDEALIMGEKLDNSAEYLDGLLSKIEMIPKSMALNPIIRNVEEARFPDFFEDLLNIYPEIHSVYAAYETVGNLTGTYRNNSKFQTEIHPPAHYVGVGEQWYDLPMSQNKFVIQDAYFDESFLKVWMVSFLNPVYDYNQTLIGMVGCDITLDKIHELVDNLSVDNENMAFVLQDSDIILAIQNSSYNGRKFEDFARNNSENALYSLVSNLELNSDNSYSGTYLDSSGSENYLYSVQLRNPNIDWKLFISIPTSVILEDVNQIIAMLSVLGVILLAIVGMLLFMLSRSITKPINSLVDITKKIAAGDIDNKIEIRSSGEIQELITNFQQMVFHIQAQISHLQYISDWSPTPIMMISKEGKIEYINKRFLEVYGYNLLEIPDLNAWFPKAYPDPEYREVVTNEWKEHVDNKKFILEKPIHFFVTAKSGERIYTGFRLMHLENGGQYLTLENETERQKQEEELLRNQKIESISLLAGGIAHDFNNILMGLLGNINLLQLEDNLPAEHVEILYQLEKAVLRGSGLTKQLLTFSKGGTPVKKIQKIKPLLMDSLSFVMTGSNSVYELDVEDDLPNVNIDAGQISQVLNNLIINAQHAMPNGGIIEVTAKLVHLDNNNEKSAKSGDFIEIEISDHGCGIPQENQKKIFSPYFTTKSKGNGLGLATAFAILKKHDGFIHFVSEVEKGTSFFINLPVSSDKPLKSEEIHFSNNDFVGRVLILDDDLIILKSVSRLLNKLGFHVDQAIDGEILIEKYLFALKTENPYDFIITDLTIPGGMGGKEAVEILQKKDPAIKAVVSSGYSNDPILSNYQQYGFIAALHKPYTVRELSAIINSILNK
ncbi:Adaptive-response sensory-kinase SasA [Candidatus Lokiarchaeum ossiferum]